MERNEAIEIVKKNWPNDEFTRLREALETLIPELAKSEDESIMEELIDYFNKYKEKEECGVKTFYGIPTYKIIDWLEKQGKLVAYYEDKLDRCACENFNKGYKKALEMQGEQKLIVWHKEDEQNLNVCLSYIPDEYLRRWLTDVVHVKYDKPTDKVEPKFKVGDWIVSNVSHEDYRICKILNGDGEYAIESIYGYRGHNNFETFDKNYHLWTIQDAKDGDVLASEDKDKIFIYNGKLDLRGRVCAYCGIYKTYDGLRFTKCAIGNYFTYKKPHPATKEQRDLLFQKMKEEGYEWNAEKKEIKEIDEEFNGEDYGIDGLYHAQRILEKTLGKVDGYQTDDGILDHKVAITTIKKLYEHKSSKWTEDDENMLQSIIATCELAEQDRDSSPARHLFEMQSNWLKSLKDRYNWKPSELQIEALESATANCAYSEYEDCLTDLIEQLKKLKA